MRNTALYIFVVAVLAICSSANDYSQYGPYNTENKRHWYQMGTFTGCKGRQCYVTVTITKPRLLRGEDYEAGRLPPFPTIFFFNGFQVRLLCGQQGRPAVVWTAQGAI